MSEQQLAPQSWESASQAHISPPNYDGYFSVIDKPHFVTQAKSVLTRRSLDLRELELQGCATTQDRHVMAGLHLSL